MRISTQAEYGVICALHLARRASDGPVTSRQIAALERLPPDFVEQILLRLRRADIVRSTRGARGGYQLARPAELVSIRDVMEASEEKSFHLNCDAHPVETGRCSASQSCSIRPVWVMLQQRIDEVLGGVRLSDLLMDESQVEARVGLSFSPAAQGGTRMLPVLL